MSHHTVHAIHIQHNLNNVKRETKNEKWKKKKQETNRLRPSVREGKEKKTDSKNNIYIFLA